MDCPIPLTVDLIPKGRGNRPGLPLTLRYITVHNTGNPGATAKNHASYIKSDDAVKNKVSWHFTVDDLGAYQHLPVDEVGYHASGGNYTSIGIEVCEVANQEQAETNAVKLIAWLMDKYGLPIGKVVPHRHWDAKYCPRLILPHWDGFVKRIDTWMYCYNPKPWNGAKEISLLREKGIIDSPHKTDDKLTWGEFATVLNRFMKGSGM